ncbi:amino acid ABC transporter ATP-binding protein [Actinomyces sp. zg-332]|uniref:amino acid ABC transporter ATP-binding protein n=1 Tax=Actinomyces sp. zg-332 TaxID=2708340 RepID=UPI0014219F51|nr:ATP-binding cassette domain-containing protein [Actinomyces sp. zg-332]QPK94576.1 amino acid ABC transporter ATP-binding protein [Actinomyces sp. zg-332]
MKALELENISKNYGTTTIFEGLNFSIEKGEIVTILGKSGGGKSTLLRCICGLEKVNSGNISILGEKIVSNGTYLSNTSKTMKKVGMVFQDYNLFENMTVEENITIAAKNQKIGTEKEIAERGEKIITELGIQGNEKKYPSQISGGQSQRVAIARALMLDPEIILFDEPTSALDIENSLIFVDIIKRLSSNGYAVIIVTHDAKLVDNLSVKTYNMVEGILQEK